MQQAFHKYSFYTWLLPVFFVLHSCNDNKGLVPAKDAIILTFFYFGITAILILLGWLIFRNYSKASLFTFILLSFYFFFGSAHDSLKRISGNGFISKYSFVLPLLLLILLILLISIKKQKKINQTFRLYLNILLIALLVFDTGRFTWNSISDKGYKKEFSDQLKTCNDCPKPDIYLIIADEYPGNRSLQEMFDFDNNHFGQELSARRFKIINKSKANYNATAYTMASLLNLNYIKGLKDTIDSKENIGICYSLIKKNQTTQFLKEQGYHFFNYSSFEFPDEPAFTAQGFLPGKTAPITSQTLSGRVIRDLWFHLATDLNWKSAIHDVTYYQLKKNNKTYEQVKRIASEYKGRPKLVYAHFIMPHNPYYYTKDGVLRTPEELTDSFRSDKKAFAEYIQYVNKKLLELIDHIKSNSVSEPVIMLAGDHGFRHYEKEVASSYQFDNFSAINLPEKKYDQFYDSMTLVNQMRTVLNIQFKQQLPLLKDSLIYIKQ